MALTREEVSIRLGVDGKAVSAGLATVSQKIDRFAKSAQSKLASVFRANIYLAATSLLTQLIPTVEEFWEKFYGTDEAAMENSKSANSRIRALVQTLKDAKADLEATIAEIGFKNASPEQKIKILENEASSAQSGKLKNQAEITKWLAFKRDMKEVMGDMFSGSDTQSRIETAIANLSTEFFKLEKIRLEVLQKIKEIQDKTKPEIAAPAEALGPHTNGPLEESPMLLNPMNKGLADYYNKIAGQFGDYGLKSEADKYKGMADAFYQAQTEASADNIQKVEIVSIKD